MDPPPRDSLGGDPIEMAKLFEGDISGVSHHDMAIVKSRSRTKSGIKVSSFVGQLQCLCHADVYYLDLGIICRVSPTPSAM